jgi:mitogen-activated protein kinase kinase
MLQQAIVDGDPPDLPAERFSEAARNFVQGCLNKIPKLRPTYSMLLQHPWLAPLLKPEDIDEEDEDAEEDPTQSSDNDARDAEAVAAVPAIVDKEVAEWVVQALERRRSGKMGGSVAPPPLHAAPLDAVSSPVREEGIQAGQAG